MLVCLRRNIKMFNFDGNLIAATRKREILYNPSSKSRMYQDLKAQAWIEVAEEMETTVKVCKTRWASLRDRYRRIEKAEQDAFQRGKKLYYKWKWYKPLSFLSNNIDTQNSFQCNPVITELEIESMLSLDQLQSMNSVVSDKITKFKVHDPSEGWSPPLAKVRKSEPKEVKPFDLSTPDTLRNNNDDASELFFKSLAIRTKQARLSVRNLLSLEAGIISLLYDKLKEIEENKKQR